MEPRRQTSADHGRREAQVPLHSVPAQIEVAVAQTERLLDVVVVELERQRLGTRDKFQLVDLDLDCAGRNVRVDRIGCARHDLAARAHDELGADRVGGLRCLGRALRVDDELHDAGVVAQVDEDQPAVVAAAPDPAGDRNRTADVVGAEVAAIEVAPAIHPEILSTSSSSCAVQSSRPGSRTVAVPSSTITVHPAPSRPAWPS